ncbi:MAG: hypothetical protein PHI27_06375 [Eubacteriales bacterium]|nr:hypothetical protein [Eubacteriales bacterium]MDD3881860.1 hypothetical protein [Eubacteriales bacterium]MDD4512895.1 hypothetical protein [Eubacteriales bacterium]
MTNAEMLYHVKTMQENQDADAATKFNLAVLADALTEKVRADAAKICGCGNAVAVLERMFKGADRASLKGAWTDESGRQCACDGFRAFRFKQPLPLASIPADERPIELHKIFEPAERRENVLIDAPTIQKVKEFIALNRPTTGKGKRKAVVLYDLGRGFPLVNAQYLLELLTVFPDAKLYAAKERGRLSVVYVVSENGDALLLPVRGAEKQHADELEARAREMFALACEDKSESREKSTCSLDCIATYADALNVAV